MPKGVYKKTEEHRRKYIESRKKNGWFRNPEETRKKMSIAKMGIPLSESHRRKAMEKSIFMDERNPAKHLTEEHRSKLALAHLGKKQTKKWLEMRSKLVLPTKDTRIEVKLQNFLKQLNIEFFTHQYMHIEHGYQCDILIPSKDLIIECFGDYWHKYPVGREIDTLRCQELRVKGYRVLVFWEREINAMELNDLKEEINGR